MSVIKIIFNHQIYIICVTKALIDFNNKSMKYKKNINIFYGMQMHTLVSLKLHL